MYRALQARRGDETALGGQGGGEPQRSKVDATHRGLRVRARRDTKERTEHGDELEETTEPV